MGQMGKNIKLYNLYVNDNKNVTIQSINMFFVIFWTGR
jgi:hypothetical protein